MCCVLQLPLGVVRREVPLCQDWSTVGNGIEDIFRIVGSRTGQALWHDAERAIGTLFNAPELFLSTCVFGYGGEFAILRDGQSAVGTGNGDLEARVAQITARFGHSGDGPLLVRTEHIVVCTADEIWKISKIVCGADEISKGPKFVRSADKIWEDK